MYFVPFQFSNYKAFLMETISKVANYVDKNYEDIDKLYKLGNKKSYYIMFIIDCFGTNFMINKKITEMLVEKYANAEKEKQNPLEILQKFYVDLFIKISENHHFPKEKFYDTIFSYIFTIFMKDYIKKMEILKKDYIQKNSDEIIEKLFENGYDQFEDIIPAYNILIFHAIHTDNKESSKFMLDIMDRAIKEHELLDKKENEDEIEENVPDDDIEISDMERIKEENNLLRKENEELKSLLKNVYAKLEEVI